MWIVIKSLLLGELNNDTSDTGVGAGAVCSPIVEYGVHIYILPAEGAYLNLELAGILS